jgi:hypothetical protein
MVYNNSRSTLAFAYPILCLCATLVGVPSFFSLMQTYTTHLSLIGHLQEGKPQLKLHADGKSNIKNAIYIVQQNAAIYYQGQMLRQMAKQP